ncbi:MAG: biopolymer transporter ExbD [Planctomycetaceae bacterium]|nr:MAG: biopolymer transporter ExbD [Planctomycetaceae bacterium]
MPLKIQALEEPQLNLTPMIDIVFNLLIFFMVGTRFADLERQFDVHLPEVTTAQPLTSLPDEIVINIFSDGKIIVRREELSGAALLERLVEARQRYAEQAVLIRGDGQADYQKIAEVLAICHKADIRNFSLATQATSEQR